jgi:hypothetical protein
MSWNLAGSYFETCSCDVVCPCTASLTLGADKDTIAHAKRSSIDAFGISYEGNSAFSTSDFAWSG